MDRDEAELFEAIFHHSGLFVIEVDGEGRITRFNPALEKASGYRAEEVLGRHVLDFFVEESHERKTASMLEDFLSGKDPGGLEYPMRTRSGGTVQTAWRTAVVRDGEGKPVGALGLGMDVTERIETEDRLRRGEEFYRLLIENALDLVSVLDRDGTILFVGPSVERILGYRPDEIAGKSIFSLLHPGDVEGARAALELAFSRPGITGSVELRVRHADGSWRVHEADSYNLLHHPLVRGMVVNSRDVTERKENERIARLQGELGINLGSTDEIQEICDIALRVAVDAAGMDGGGVYLLDEGTGELRLVSHAGLSREFLEQAISFAPDTPEARLADQGRPVYAGCGETGLPFSGARLAEGLKAVAFLPITHEGRVVGCLNLVSRRMEEVPESARRAIEAVLGHVSQAMVRARLVERLRESEERYRLLHDHAGEAIYTFDRDLKLLSVNRAACEKVGYAEEELLGRNVLELGILHPGDAERVVGNIARLLDGESPVRDELRFIRKDGAELFVDVTSADILGPSGEVVAVTNLALDVTEQRRAEEEINLLMQAVEQSVDGIAVADLEGKVLYVNGAWAEMHGYGRKEIAGELIGKSLEIFHTPEQMREEVSPLNREALEKGAASGEVGHMRKNGSVFPAMMSTTVFRDEGGDPRGFIGVARDISEMKRVEEELRRSEATYREIFDAVNDAIFVHDPETGVILDVNRRMTEMYGFTREEALSLSVVDISSGASPYDQERAVELVRKAAGEPQLFEWHARRKNGELFWVEVNLKRGTIAGEERVLAIVHEITERRKMKQALRDSEEWYRATFETTGTAMFLVDRSALIVEANREMENVFGYSRDEVVGRKRYMELLMPEDVDRVKRYSRLLLTGEIKGPAQFEIRARHRSGRAIEALVSVNMLPEVERSVISLMDITDKKIYERELEQRAEQLRDFLDIAAHELRHPATLLKGYAMTINRHGDRIDRGTWSESLEAIEAGADRLVYVVEELLDVSRLQRGIFTLNEKEAPVMEAVDMAAQEMRARAKEREIVVTAEGDLGAARLDHDRLSRLLIILLDNAVKYSPAGESVELRAKRAGEELEFAVMDRGAGVPEDKRESIFERFVQVGDALHHSGPGLGLGLYIAKRIVSAHGGRIWHEPREGGGSVFRFVIPLSRS